MSGGSSLSEGCLEDLCREPPSRLVLPRGYPRDFFLTVFVDVFLGRCFFSAVGVKVAQNDPQADPKLPNHHKMEHK